MKKVALITGTSSGLGLETSILLAKNGFTVYATMRNLQKQGKLTVRMKEESVELNVLELEVTSEGSIDSCVSAIVEKEGKIDVLINNAGAGFAKTTEQATDEEIKWVTDVNYLGVVRCTKAVLPHMRKNGGGHIINITSVGGLVGQPFNELYCGAKFAVEGFTEALATYVSEPFRIMFSIVEPGGIVSEFMNSAMEKTMTDGQLTTPDYQPILNKYMSGIQQRSKEGRDQVYQTPTEVANVILKVISMEKPPLRVRTSEWAEEFTALKTHADPDGTKLVNQVIEQFLK